jgi:hypothetical protein
MNAKKKAARGGSRPGAGRPRKYEEGRSVTYRFPQSLVDQIEAERGDFSANEWVVKKLTAAPKSRPKKGE